jgi:TRAP-type C4-dicarboxylate transport system permease small subunit
VRAAVAALSAVLDLLARGVILLAGATLVALVISLIWMVFGRYVLNDTPTWVERGALLAILYVALPVAGVGVRERFHMAVELVVAALPPAARPVVAIAADLALFALGFIMVTWAWVLVGNYWAFRIPLLGISQGWQFVPMVICGALTMLFVAEHLLRRLAGLPPLGRTASD